MTDEPEIEVEVEDEDAEEPRPCILGDGDCIIFDADGLDDDPESEGVLAASFIDGALFYLPARTRVWTNADVSKRPKAKPRAVT